MCRRSLTIDKTIIQDLLDDLLDQVSLMNSPSPMNYSTSLFSSKSIENLFDHPIQILNRTIKQIFTHELNTVVLNGTVTNTGATIRNSRYYNPTTSIKQTNDLRKRYSWMQQRKTFVNCLNENNENQIEIDDHNILNSKSIENLWFDHRFFMLQKSLEARDKEQIFLETDDEVSDNLSTCSRCQIYQRKSFNEKPLVRKLQRFKKIQRENFVSNVLPSSESDLIISIAKIADRIGHQANINTSNSLKKMSSSTITNNRKKSTNTSIPILSTVVSPKSITTSISVTVAETNRNSKRSLEDGKHLTNSQSTTNNFDTNQKRQKRIASPLSVSSTTMVTGPVSSSSPREILTPSWRVLNNTDMEVPLKFDKTNDSQDVEDISDEAYIRRHERCELTDGPG